MLVKKKPYEEKSTKELATNFTNCANKVPFEELVA
jgi:hypothetical protein